MYLVRRNDREILEADACGIGFLATRNGVASRKILDLGLSLTREFDHRGAPGHGAGVQLEIPWELLMERFPRHAKEIAAREVSLGMFFMPFDNSARAACVERVEELAFLAGSDVLQWKDVPVGRHALAPDSPALRTFPVVRQALFQRPKGLSERGWFACRYLLRLALDSEKTSEDFSLASLSNRTVVYKGLAELSKIDQLYPDLADPACASRFLLFHSRYCTNTSTAWKRAQPFWGLAHNGEITTIRGNVAWFEALSKDLLAKLVAENPSLSAIAKRVHSIVASGGSDTANLDDMAIALMAGGMSLPQSILALLPESRDGRRLHTGIESFYRAMGIYLGACDGPAALVCCDGDDAVAHLDRNGLRPLWVWADDEVVFAGSEITEHLVNRPVRIQRCMGPGDSFVLRLADGHMAFDDECAGMIAMEPTQVPTSIPLESAPFEPVDDLVPLQKAFGMNKEDLEVILDPLITTGKAAVGSMGDDTPPAAILDDMPRRLEDYFALRFAQETSPAIDPIRDEWVFDTTGWLGDRGGLWGDGGKGLFRLPNRILTRGELAWLKSRSEVKAIALLADLDDNVEAALTAVILKAEELAEQYPVILLTDRQPGPEKIALSSLRAVSRLHASLGAKGIRHRVGIVVEAGIWDINQCAVTIAMGADAVQPWIGSETAGEAEATYVKGVRNGFLEVMSMVGVTPSSAYCGAALVEAIGLDADFVQKEFPKVPHHLGGVGVDVLNREWRQFHRTAFGGESNLQDVGEFRQSKNGRAHFNDAGIVRGIQLASGYAKKIHGASPGSYNAYRAYAQLVEDRKPITVLDCLQVRKQPPIRLSEVEPADKIVWRFMAPGMSEGALSEPAHRTVARAFNMLNRICRASLQRRGECPPFGVGPIANSGEGGFDKERIGTRDGNRSVQYAGGRFTITPGVAANADETEVKFAQGAKPGKGGQLPGKKVNERVARQRGCEPGFELVSPPINHNLYSIEDVKLMVESWRTLNPNVNCALKFVATYGVEMVAVGGANAGANRLHISDGCGGTGAAKRVDQKHAGIPAAAVLPKVQDRLIEEGLRESVELSVDGGVQCADQFLKLVILGADRVGFGTSVLMAIGCSMLRKCHLTGPDPSDPTGKRRLGCAPGIATQDPVLVGAFRGKSKHIVQFLLHVAEDVRVKMAAAGIRSLSEVVGRRDLLEKKPELTGKARDLDCRTLLGVPSSDCLRRKTPNHPRLHHDHEVENARQALAGIETCHKQVLGRDNRCIGVAAAGEIARSNRDQGLRGSTLCLSHRGAAGHYYAAYSLPGMSFELTGVAADSCFTASYGGRLIIRPDQEECPVTLVGNTFAYGARGGEVYIAGRAGNRFGICLRKSHEGAGARIVVEGLEANAFQYMTGGVALVLGTVGRNLGAGMTGGTVYIWNLDALMLNENYVVPQPLDQRDVEKVLTMLADHERYTGSKVAASLRRQFDPSQFSKVQTRLLPEKFV
jgi:glutamate synthase domain-containing protein 2/glutamate synthase domain-containing protein 1/glutamate synthase domain-containing protein 3